MLGPARAAVNEARARFGLRALVWAVLLAALAVALAFIPLFDVLGYDFCFASGWPPPWRPSTSGRVVVAVAGTPSRRRRRCCACAGLACARGGRGAAGGAAAGLARQRAARPQLQLRRRASGSSPCCPSRRCCTRRPRGCWPGWRSRGAARLVAFVLPGALAALDAACASTAIRPCSPSTRSAATSPDRSTTRRCARRRRCCVFRLVNLVWIATAVALGAAAIGRGLDPRRWRAAALAAAAPLLVAASLVLYATGGQPPASTSRAPICARVARATADHRPLRRALRARGEDARRPRADRRGPRVPLPAAARHAGRRARGPITVWEFPSADVKKALVGAGGTLYARPLDARDLRADRSLPGARAAPRDGARVRRRVRRSAVRGVAGLALARARCRCRRWPSGLIEGIAEAASAASDPDERRDDPRRGARR